MQRVLVQEYTPAWARLDDDTNTALPTECKRERERKRRRERGTEGGRVGETGKGEDAVSWEVWVNAAVQKAKREVQ